MSNSGGNRIDHARLNIVATELPALFDEFEPDADAREGLRGYIEGIQDWMAGELAWQRVTGRYQHAEAFGHPVLTRLLTGPTGFGTSAARIGALVGGRTSG